MGLFRSLRRVKPQGAAEGAGGKASDIKSSPQAVPGTEGVTFEDFKAEAEARKLSTDWKAPRLELLFKIFDLNGNGWVDQEEFSSTAQQLITLLQALDDAPAEKKHVVAMPAILQSFTPLKEFEQVSAALAKLKPLEDAMKADAASDAKREALATGLETAKTVLERAIDARVGERGIVPLCDAVIATGDDFFVGTYDEIWSSVSKSEDVKGCESDADRLIGAAKDKEAAHRTWLQEHGA